MGGGASKTNWQRHHYFTSNTKNPVDEQTYTQIFPVWSIAVTRNGLQLAAATNTGHDNVIVLWCLAEPNMQIDLAKLIGHADTIWRVTYSPDDTMLASASADGTIRIWQVSNGMPLLIFPRRHAAWVWSLAWSPDGMRLASGGADAKILIWDAAEAVATAQELQNIKLDAMEHDDVDPEEIAEVAEEAARACMPLLYWQAHEKGIVGLQYAPSDPKQLVSIGKEGTLAIWDASSGALDIRVNGHIGPITCVAISPKTEEIIATGGDDHTVRLWDMRDIEPGTTMARQSREKQMGYNLPHYTLKGHEGAITVVRFCRDGELLASGSKDCEVRIWLPDVRNSPTLFAKFVAHEAWVGDLQWTWNQKYLYTCSNDGHIFAFQVPTRFFIKDLPKKRPKKGSKKYEGSKN
eukprot:TRINITY_DN5988_c0_g2_i1.p1 TRINITY_DN5988_c0_g2~~TRINITY_DN5988_c0_g2_i1.p1  ORF type:complete len:406 (-),score=66.51 TRINITY_DN5988_c0_g2_i1:52-1269(-)